MKNILVILSLFSCAQLNAQPWVEKINDDRPTLQEIISAHNNTSVQPDDETKDYAKDFEGKGYHFDRWVNFWEGRTDEQGRLVSPRRHWEELRKLQSRNKQNNTMSKGTATDANWIFHGPVNPLGGNSGVGRINCIEFHPTDTNTYMIGSPGGGLWRTTNDGTTWQALNDFFPILGISDIDYNPANPNTIYVCTGDKDAGDTYSMGVFKSTDGGTTWDTTGFQYKFQDVKKIYGLIVNKLDTNILTMACTDGIYKSNDAAKTWTRTFAGNIQQVLQHPTDTSILYALNIISFSRQFMRSSDGGYTWQNIQAFSGSTRAEVAVTPANPAIVKIVVANSAFGLDGIYNSTDTGKSFTKIYSDSNCSKNILASTPKGDECGGQGWYDLSIQISPDDANLVVVGGVNTWVSTTGGTSWKLVNQWKNTVTGVTIVHADKHAHRFHPLKPTALFECNDGGIYKTLTPTATNAIWNDLTLGLGITQFYRNAVAPNTSFALGGAQDNGTKMLTGGTSKQMTGADGMDCQIDPIDSNRLYTSQQYGELRRSADGGKNFTDIQNNIPGKPEGAWITPLVIHPNNNAALITGYKYVYYSTDYGDSWQTASPNFFNNITRIAVTPIDQQYIYAAIAIQGSNTVRYTKDFGGAWNVIVPLINNTYVSDIMVDPYRKDSLWITFRDYAGVKVAVVDTRDTQWTTFDAALPDVPVNCITFDPANQTFYIGTDLGVFFREYKDTAWEYFNNNTLPNVEVMDLGINSTSNTLWAATYGRGMWSTPLHKSTTGVANLVPYKADILTIFPNPNHGNFTIRSGQRDLFNAGIMVRITDITGKIVYMQPVHLNQNGVAEISTKLSQGTYVVEAVKDGIIFAKTKMVTY